MQTSIIKIGNSSGLIIPADILKSLGLGLKSVVNITSDNGTIVIKSSSRNGWAQAAAACHEAGEDTLILPDVFEDEKFIDEEWTW